MKYNTRRQVWERIEQKCCGKTHVMLWERVCDAKDATALPWWRVMDKVVGDGWRRFSPEVSGNRL